MQYVFFNNDSRFYKINVNLLNLLKDISTQGTSVILCAWWLGLTLQKLPLSPPLPTPMGGIHIFLFLAC